MSTDFQELVEEFELLARKADEASGNDLRLVRRDQARVEKLIAAVTESGVYSYNGDYTDCRDIGHRWEERFNQWEGNEFSRMCHCDRCGSERYDAFSRTGALVHRKYVYAEGYLLSDKEIRDLGGKVRRYWRAVNIQRTISGA